ncbi:PorV/PorQ family protein, partial [Candidatus Aerophobetes bacterium]|nr:PorV/PorQ family protein [Candidatus Aerophobetes bacterium]
RGVIICILLLVLTTTAKASGPGATAANFLKIDIGAKAASMGGAFTAVADDGSAIYFNPAGIARITSKKFFATYNMWFQEISQGYLSYIFPSPGGGWGISLNYVDAGKMQGYDEEGYPTEVFGASDILLQIAYARKITGKAVLGLSAGYLVDTIKNSTETAFHANIGMIASLSPFSSFGVALQNIGSSLEKDSLPFTGRVGFSKRIGPFLFAFDTVFPNDNDAYFCAGFEFSLSRSLFLRTGYRSGIDEGSGISAGLGLNFKKTSLDWAYVPYGDLGDTHRISLSLTL